MFIFLDDIRSIHSNTPSVSSVPTCKAHRHVLVRMVSAHDFYLAHSDITMAIGVTDIMQRSVRLGDTIYVS